MCAGLAALEVVQQRGKVFQEIKDKFANRYVKFFKGLILKEACYHRSYTCHVTTRSRMRGPMP